MMQSRQAINLPAAGSWMPDQAQQHDTLWNHRGSV